MIALRSSSAPKRPPALRPTPPRTGARRRFFTIGSPLEKIRFFWPWTVRTEALFRASAAPRLTRSRAGRTLHCPGGKPSRPSNRHRCSGVRTDGRCGSRLDSRVSRRVAIPMVWSRNSWSSSSERDGVIHLVRVEDRDAAAHAGPSQRGEADLRERAPKLRLMQDFVSGDFVEVFDVRNFKRAHGLNRRRQSRIGMAGSFPPRQCPPCGSQSSKDLRAIEPLPCTVLTETHFVLTSSSILLRVRAMSHFSFPTVL